MSVVFKRYRSRGGYDFSVKRRISCGENDSYALCTLLPRSGEWMPIPGEPEYPTRAAAETRLDELAGINRWRRVDELGFAWRVNN